jgi:hypothetical protein
MPLTISDLPLLPDISDASATAFRAKLVATDAMNTVMTRISIPYISLDQFER